jgi:hypothetical protein
MDCRIESHNNAILDFAETQSRLRYSGIAWRRAMTNGPSVSLDQIEDRIAITRDNIRQLIEQAAAFSGAGDEARNADRLAQQEEELETLTKQRDEMLKRRE